MHPNTELVGEFGRGAAVSIVRQDGWKNWSCLAAGMSAELMQQQSEFLQSIYRHWDWTHPHMKPIHAHTFNIYTVTFSPVFYFCRCFIFLSFTLTSGVKNCLILLWASQHVGRWVIDRNTRTAGEYGGRRRGQRVAAGPFGGYGSKHEAPAMWGFCFQCLSHVLSPLLLYHFTYFYFSQLFPWASCFLRLINRLFCLFHSAPITPTLTLSKWVNPYIMIAYVW